jgi:hypothetical protein
MKGFISQITALINLTANRKEEVELLLQSEKAFYTTM